MKNRNTTLLASALLLSTQLLFASNSYAEEDEDIEPEGGIGIGNFARYSVQASKVEVAPERDDNGTLSETSYDSSIALKFALDLSALILPSVNNNKHGFEGSVSVTLFPFDFDVWGGTAVTMLSLGHGGIGTLRVRGGFGVGMSYNHTYAYLKTQAAAVIVPDKIDVEASLYWIPNQVSHAWGDNAGDFDEQRRRASLYYKRGEDKAKIELYLEHTDRLRGGHAEDFSFPRENFTVRDPDDDMRGFGVGVSMMTNF